MSGIQAFLTRKVGPLPVYAYGIVLVGAGVGVLWLRGRLNTGDAAAIPQVNSDIGDDNLPLPFPDPGVGAGVPPTQAFDTSGQTAQGFTSQSNMVQGQSVSPMSGGTVAMAGAPTIAPGSRFNEVGQKYQPSTATSRVLYSLRNVPFIGSRVQHIVPRSSGPSPAQYTGGSAFGRNPG